MARTGSSEYTAALNWRQKKYDRWKKKWDKKIKMIEKKLAALALKKEELEVEKDMFLDILCHRLDDEEVYHDYLRFDYEAHPETFISPPNRRYNVGDNRRLAPREEPL